MKVRALKSKGPRVLRPYRIRGNAAELYFEIISTDSYAWDRNTCSHVFGHFTIFTRDSRNCYSAS